MLPTTATASAPPPPPPPAAGPASSPGEPHAALLLALGYMRLRELLACTRACRGLREAVAGDPLLWLRLVVEPPLSHRITDEALLALTVRAQGRLRSLHLLGCPRVSDAGLLRIVERNPDVTEAAGEHLYSASSYVTSGVRSLEQLSTPKAAACKKAYLGKKSDQMHLNEAAAVCALERERVLLASRPLPGGRETVLRCIVSSDVADAGFTASSRGHVVD